MRISGVRPDPFAARSAGLVGDSPPSAAAPVDLAQVARIPESELTPAVQAAIAMLAGELEDLRTQIKHLRARLLEAEAEADEDPLTGVRNRRAFVRELGRICAFAQRYAAPASLIYIDLDDLKAINDRLGHAAGDAALKAVAERLGDHVRESDAIGRMGGDEFAVALLHADHATALAKASALAELIEAAAMGREAGAATIRVSFGVVQIDPTEDAEALIARADGAMFAMKRARA
jgi:diguanylate cyclase (GGDEF)-like protein